MPPLEYHESVSSLLGNLSNLEQSLGPTELIAMWFGDFYFPAQTRPADYSGAVWERGQVEWRECFTDRERAVLSKFHEVFAKESGALSEDWGTWRSDPGWKRVSEAAREALGEIAQMRSNNSL